VNPEFKLTEEQSRVLEGIKAWFLSKQSKALLKGCAGVGKTSVISKFVEMFQKEFPTKTIVLVAPTHKALKVLQNMCEARGIKTGIEFCTIHALLGLRRVVDGYGNEKFKRESGKAGKDKSGDYDLIICDEASMISSELLQYISDDAKIIWIADGFQLNPINEEQSPIFDLDILTFELKNIVRQAEGNRIIGFSKSIREKGGISDVREYLDTGDIMLMPGKTFESNIHDVFASEEYKKDGNYCRVLCYTNKEVDKWNKFIRHKLFPDSKRLIEIGEKLIFRRPSQHPDDKRVFSFDTNDEVTVVGVKEDLFTKNKYVLKSYLCEGRDENFGKVASFRLLHEDCFQEYEEVYAKLEKEAKDLPQGTNEARQAWIRLYDFRDSFSYVQGASACTVHVSQGSTFKKSFVICNDFNLCRKPKEQVKLFYTAITRASEQVILVTK